MFLRKISLFFLIFVNVSLCKDEPKKAYIRDFCKYTFLESNRFGEEWMQSLIDICEKKGIIMAAESLNYEKDLKFQCEKAVDEMFLSGVDYIIYILNRGADDFKFENFIKNDMVELCIEGSMIIDKNERYKFCKNFIKEKLSVDDSHQALTAKTAIYKVLLNDCYEGGIIKLVENVKYHRKFGIVFLSLFMPICVVAPLMLMYMMYRLEASH
jgi:hypothetical protein